MQVAVDDSHNKVIWPHLQRAENQFWVLFYKEGARYRVIIAEAARVLQEPYTEGSYPEDLLSVFTSPDAATLYIAAIGKEVGVDHNENFRVVSMSKRRFLQFIADLDKEYGSRQNAYLRVDICEYKNRELRREILFSRLIPKH